MIENYAQEFSKKIIDNGLMDIKPKTKEKSAETDYQLVSSIRYQLKQKGIKYDWRNIIRIMNTQKEVYSTIKTKSGSTIQLKKCTRPTVQTKEIYTALSLKHKPYNIKKSVVP